MQDNYFRINGKIPNHINTHLDNGDIDNIMLLHDFAHNLYDLQHKKFAKIIFYPHHQRIVDHLSFIL